MKNNLIIFTQKLIQNSFREREIKDTFLRNMQSSIEVIFSYSKKSFV
jgi:hypothetical protein